MKFVGIYIYLFFLLFGPKFFGVVDTSILANIVVFCLLGGYKIKYPPFIIELSLWILSIILCYMGVAIYYESIDVVFVGRLLRSLCSVICLYAFCCFFGEYAIEVKKDWMINVLLCHAVLVLFSATIYTDLQYYLKMINDFQAHIRAFRSTGLTAGFDISGLLCNLGVVLVLVKRKFCIWKFIIFILAVIFTSRFSIVSLFFILLFYLIWMKGSIEKVKFICVCIPLFSVGFIGLLLFALTTTMVPESLFSSFQLSNDFLETLKWTYAHSDLKLTSDRYFVFPETFFSLLFGLGYYGGTDPGYMRIINCVGILGLLLIILWHVVFFYKMFSYKFETFFEKKEKRYNEFVFIAVLLFLNMKNSYFFTGTFFEIMLFVSFNYMIESLTRNHIYINQRRNI